MAVNHINHDISGKVIDNITNQPVGNVTLELRDYPQGQNVITTATTDANGNYTIPNLTTFNHYSLRASKLDYTFSPQKRTYVNLAASQTGADFTGTLQVQPSDFDGDGRSDIAVWRPSEGVWYVNLSSDGNFKIMQWGLSTDVPVPGDYDQDGKTDFGVFRPAEGNWYVLRSSTGSYLIQHFGQNGDMPIPAAYR